MTVVQPKPVVQYDVAQGVALFGRKGTKADYAILSPINHPSDLVSNEGPATTSAVVRIHDNGCFETQNTIYVPAFRMED